MAVISLTSFASTYAYVTYQDIRQLGNLRDQTVIVVKAPTDTKLEVPDPEEVYTQTHSNPNQIHYHSPDRHKAFCHRS